MKTPKVENDPGRRLLDQLHANANSEGEISALVQVTLAAHEWMELLDYVERIGGTLDAAISAVFYNGLPAIWRLAAHTTWLPVMRRSKRATYS